MMSIAHLRYKTLWVGIGILMLVTVAVASVISLPAPVKSVMLHDKVLHTVAYAGLMGWFAQIYRHDLTRLLLAVALMMMGVVIEFIQGTVPQRQFDVLDMVANTSGVLLAWALAYTWVGNVLEKVEGWFFRAIPRVS